MAIIKSYTDLEQSKKLAEILPLESADMYYFSIGLIPPIKLNVGKVSDVTESKRCWTIPCWSLAALLDVLPKGYSLGNKKSNDKYNICMTFVEHDVMEHDNLVDACYEMIIKLKENNLL